ncbi:MAG TPA: PepSY domain-containing protein [Caulobacteraceae bacterium]|nr:PepSY domain-containing protein [Caulobacteraceae bacterium]
MKPILTALAGVAIAASLAATSFAQPPPNQANHHNERRPPVYEAPPRHAPPPNIPPPGPPQRSPNSLGAGWALQQDEVRQGVTQRRLVPLGQVIEQLGRRMGGRQLDAGLEYQGGRPIYRVRWITRDGRRVDMLIDAATGATVSGG